MIFKDILEWGELLRYFIKFLYGYKQIWIFYTWDNLVGLENLEVTSNRRSVWPGKEFIPDLLGHMVCFASRALRLHSLNTCLPPFSIYLLCEWTLHLVLMVVMGRGMTDQSLGAVSVTHFMAQNAYIYVMRLSLVNKKLNLHS